jgi:hypothetical protein
MVLALVRNYCLKIKTSRNSAAENINNPIKAEVTGPLYFLTYPDIFWLEVRDVFPEITLKVVKGPDGLKMIVDPELTCRRNWSER